MLAANHSYEEGRYQEAAAAYEAIIEAGIHNSDLYYNLGNAYFKQGDWGRAILNYRRARRLAPRDGDIALNLQLARAQTLDQLGLPQENELTNWIQIAEEWLTLREAALLALFLWLAVCFLLALAILLPRWRFWLGWLMAVAGLLLVLGVGSIGNRLYRDYRAPPAVIVAEEIKVTGGPGMPDQYLTEFILHSGAEVRLLEKRDQWRRIVLDELQGWVPAAAVEPVILQ